jgi:hypothetical protein
MPLEKVKVTKIRAVTWANLSCKMYSGPVYRSSYSSWVIYLVFLLSQEHFLSQHLMMNSLVAERRTPI